MKQSAICHLLGVIFIMTCFPLFSQVCFSDQTYSASAASPYKIISSDFNNDGWPDLAYTNYYGQSLDLRLNNSGSFPSKITYTIKGSPMFMVAADFNKDGFQDLAFTVSHIYVPEHIQLFYGDGTGQFSDAGKIIVEVQPVVAVGDFNGDGHPDLVVNSNTYLKFFLNNGSGGFPSLSYSISAGAQCGSIRCIDINKDGLDDLVATDFNKGKVLVYLTLLNAAPQLVEIVKTTDSPLDAIAFDFTGDEKTDLAVGHSLGLSVYAGNGLGKFYFLQTIPATRINELALADLDGDKKPEIVYCSGPGSYFSYLYCHGPGSYSVVTDKFPTGKYPYSVVTADFDNDGKSDVSTANLNSDNISVFYNRKMQIAAPPVLCIGSGAILKATVADSYTWHPSLQTIQSISVTAVQLTTYSVTGVVNNCKTTATVQVKVDDCLSVADKNNDDKFKLFPNPCNDKIIINSQNATALTIYNCIGGHVFSQQIKGTQTEVNLEFLPEGLYFVQLSSGQKKSFIVSR